MKRIIQSLVPVIEASNTFFLMELYTYSKLAGFKGEPVERMVCNVSSLWVCAEITSDQNERWVNWADGYTGNHQTNHIAK